MSSPTTGYWLSAQAQFGRREWPQARRTLQQLLAIEPGNAAAWMLLSYVESHLDHYRAARDCALQVHATGSRNERVVMELISRLRTFNEAELMLRYIDALPALEHVTIPVLLTIAAQLSYLNEQERAMAFLDEALRGDPDYPPTRLARAQVLIYLGRFDEANADLQACLRLAPGLGSTYWHLSRMPRGIDGGDHVATLRRLLDAPARDPEHGALVGYALHNELDRRGDHAGAWQALERACRSKRALLDYRMEDTRALVDALIAMPTGPVAPSQEGARTPIFITGMHRSGTTLLEQLLDGHPDVKGVGELYDFTSQMRMATDHHCRGVVDTTIVERAAQADFSAVGAGYMAKMEWRLGRERWFTDKLPSNFLNIGFICRALPQAKILRMVRDPVEVGFSNLRELFSDANPYSYDQLEFADFHRQYERLMAHWHRAWPGRILDVSYAALTREPEATMREVANFCGLSFDPAMLDLRSRTRGVATASAVQVRQRIEVREQPKWKPYEAYLQPLIEALDGCA